MTTVLVDKRDDGVALVTLNRPDSLNSLGEDMLPRLASTLDELADDPEVRCVAITGAGRAFCAGGDVKRMDRRRENNDALENPVGTLEAAQRALFENQMGVSERLRTMPKPTVALVNGHAVGAGQSIALACDIRIASERAKFGTAFRNVGLSGDYGGSYFLQRLVGNGKARELYFTGQILTAEEADTLGMVNKVVPHEDLMIEGLEFCAELAAGPTAAYGRMKANLTVGETGSLADVLRQEAHGMVMSRFDEDHSEAVRAFIEKRPPEFKGR